MGLKQFLEWVSGGAILAALAGIIPAAAALLGAIYYIILIYESKTFKDWRQRRRLQRAVKLEAKASILRQHAELRQPPAHP